MAAEPSFEGNTYTISPVDDPHFALTNKSESSSESYVNVGRMSGGPDPPYTWRVNPAPADVRDMR